MHVHHHTTLLRKSSRGAFYEARKTSEREMEGSNVKVIRALGTQQWNGP